MLTLIYTVVGAFVAQLLYDRFKGPIPRYGFEFEEGVPYQSAVPAGFNFHSGTEYLENYIYIENYGEDVWLSNVSTAVYFKNKKERTNYQRMGITDNLFNLQIEDLPTQFPLEYRIHRPQPPSLPTGKEEVIEEKTKIGLFVSGSDMQKLKCLTPVEVKVEYEWNGKRGRDIWLFDFSDENEVRFSRLPSPIWRKVVFLFKRFL